jgi:hypothetical protein
MNSLKLYYSYTKNPSPSSQAEGENLVLIVHPPAFVLSVYDSIHSQKADTVVLFFFVARYYFIIQEIVSPKEHARIETNARAPPLKEV